MCGICGIAGPGIIESDIKAFRDLLYISALRGDHSTGVATIRTSDVPGDDWWQIEKEAISADYFLFKDECRKAPVIKGTYNTIFLGHCRYATKGDVNDENAHPFETEKFIGMHNGTLEDKEFEHKELTDSQLLMEKISIEGAARTLDALDAESAFAVALWEKGSEVLTLSRNEHRTLYIAINKNRPVLYFASELEMLHLALSRRNMQYDSYELLPYKVYYISMDWLKKNYGKDDISFELEDIEDKTGMSWRSWMNPNHYSSSSYSSTLVYPDFEDKREKKKKEKEKKKYSDFKPISADDNPVPWNDHECDFCGKPLEDPEVAESDDYFGKIGDFTSMACRSCLPIMKQVGVASH